MKNSHSVTELTNYSFKKQIFIAKLLPAHRFFSGVALFRIRSHSSVPEHLQYQDIFRGGIKVTHVTAMALRFPPRIIVVLYED